MRVIYETTDDCKQCPFNTGHICLKLGKYLFDICFEEDCPLPTLEGWKGLQGMLQRIRNLNVMGIAGTGNDGATISISNLILVCVWVLLVLRFVLPMANRARSLMKYERRRKTKDNRTPLYEV